MFDLQDIEEEDKEEEEPSSHGAETAAETLETERFSPVVHQVPLRPLLCISSQLLRESHAATHTRTHRHTQAHITIVLTHQHTIRTFTSSLISTPGAAAAEVKVHIEGRRPAVA